MRRFFYGAFGSIVPDICIFKSKPISAPLLEFNILQYSLAIFLYAIAAGLVARIYPYNLSRDERWNSFVVGVTLPVIISGLISAYDRGILDGTNGLRLRGPTDSSISSYEHKEQGTLIDLLALY